jgi:hypothetical protein
VTSSTIRLPTPASNAHRSSVKRRGNAYDATATKKKESSKIHTSELLDESTDSRGIVRKTVVEMVVVVVVVEVSAPHSPCRGRQPVTPSSQGG